MRKGLLLGAVLAVAAHAAAAPNVTNVTQKGSLMVFPEIRVDGDLTTMIRIQNDGGSDVNVKCYWMDGNKNRVDFVIPVTRNQPVWFDAKTGQGTYQVNPFPTGVANGFDNPWLVTPPAADEDTDTAGPYRKGLLACWAVDPGGQNQVKWNHLSGTATIWSAAVASPFQYSAYAFFVPGGLDLEPVGVAGTLNLNGVEYDSCPLYQTYHFSPVAVDAGGRLAYGIRINRLSIAGCTLDLKQDWTPVWTKLQFDVWNEDEVKFTGAYECADSWHETNFDNASVDDGGPIDAGQQSFVTVNLGTYAARYRVQGVKSTQCEAPGRVTQAVGILGVHEVGIAAQVDYVYGNTLTSAGKSTGKISWDPAGTVPEGRIR